jgi:hypothetical protein
LKLIIVESSKIYEKNILIKLFILCLGGYIVNKKFMVIGALLISSLIVSTATAVPQAKARNIDQILEKKNTMGSLEKRVIDINDLIQLILKIMRFLQNLSSVILGLLTPLLPLIELIITFLTNLLERLDPWVNLVEAIITVIEAINVLIEAIQNIINPPIFIEMI